MHKRVSSKKNYGSGNQLGRWSQLVEYWDGWMEGGLGVTVVLFIWWNGMCMELGGEIWLVRCRAWACWSVAMNLQNEQGMWATRIRLWCWWYWSAIQKPRQYDRLKWFWFAIQKPRSFHDPMVSTWDFGGLQCIFCVVFVLLGKLSAYPGQSNPAWSR